MMKHTMSPKLLTVSPNDSTYQYLKKLIFSVIDEYEYRDSNSYNDGIFVDMVTKKGDE